MISSKNTYFIPKAGSSNLFQVGTNNQKIHMDKHKQKSTNILNDCIFIINTNVHNLDRCGKKTMCCVKEKIVSHLAPSDSQFRFGFILAIDNNACVVHVALSKVALDKLLCEKINFIKDEKDFNNVFDIKQLESKSFSNDTNIYLLNFASKNYQPAIFSPPKDDIFNNDDYVCMPIKGPDTFVFDYIDCILHNVCLSTREIHSTLYTKNSFNQCIHKNNKTSNQRRKRKSGRITGKEKKQKIYYQNKKATALKRTYYVTPTGLDDNFVSRKIHEKRNVKFSEFLDYNKKQKPHAVPFLQKQHQGTFGIMEWETFQKKIRSKNGELTAKQHDQLLIQHSTYFKHYSTIDMDEEKNRPGVKFRAMSKQELQSMKEDNVEFDTTDTVNGILYSRNESEYVHKPNMGKSNIKDTKKKYDNTSFPGVVVSQWLFCPTLNPIDLSIDIVDLVTDAFTQCGFGPRGRCDSKGFNFYIGERGSNQASTSSFQDVTVVRHSQYHRETFNTILSTKIHAITNKLSIAATTFSNSCDYLMDIVSVLDCDANMDFDFVTKRGCRVKIITCGNKVLLGFCCSMHKDTKDSLYANLDEVMDKIRTKYEISEEDAMIFRNYLDKWFNYAGIVGVPTTCVYQFLGSANITKQDHTLDFHIYFLMDDFELAVKIASHVAHTFHSYSFYHCTAVPCVIVDGKVFYHHEDLNIFAWGAGGSKQKTS